MNPEPKDYKSSALTTGPFCLLYILLDLTLIARLFADYTEASTNNANPTTRPADDNKLEIIIPLIIVGILLILVLVMVFVFWRRRLKQRDAVDNAHAIAKKGSITMRDRLRAESLKSLDSRLLRLYDPNKLKQYRLDHVQYVKDLGEGFFGKVFQGMP